RGAFYGPYWLRADAAEISPGKDSKIIPTQAQIADRSITSNASLSLGQGLVAQLTIPLHITVSLGSPTSTTSSVPAPATNSDLPTAGPVSAPPVATTRDLAHPFSSASLSEAAVNWKAALTLALASRLSYETPAEIEDTAREHWGF